MSTLLSINQVSVGHASIGRASVLGAVLVLACCGCGNQNVLGKVVVEGLITLDGEPIPNGEIRFYPSGDTHGPVSGAPIKDGKYVAKGKGGVPIGTHHVDIRAFRADKNAAADPEGGPAEQYLPAKFNTETSLTATIEPSTTSLDFPLKSE
ncbi:hypothetical protein [Adhaeretor mobilis]|uniref:Carboxypeptidase regulatory-like domain-containing protein n=1 Tax=Adhaeretor mobilis TaxID=1930276 RepID=A0A517MVB6_9BACT|nr:hypothetical protein [Adhaeretor mobilis]QDS98818.1 hypothetical protein HG15A2_21030 [Adhaeretor mobilis]